MGKSDDDAAARGTIREVLRVPQGERFDLSTIDPQGTGLALEKRPTKDATEAMQDRLDDLQERLHAGATRSVLVVLQAMDTGGKDSTIRRVFGPLNPQGVRVTSFKTPTPEELAHDYLWRIHRKMPRKGMVRIFNRSHYEDVVIVRVHGWADPEILERRYDEINAFERHLAANGTTIIKFYLHISKEEQRERLQDRLDRPHKHWKFNAGDIEERAVWDAYMDAYERALGRCSTPWAPWYVIPANRKWIRDYAVAAVTLDAIERLDPAYPPPEPGLDEIVIDG